MIAIGQLHRFAALRLYLAAKFGLPIWWRERVRYGAVTVTIPIFQGVGAVHLTSYEPWMDDLLAKIFSIRSGYFIDVGAHLGENLIKTFVINQNIFYVGFEPNSWCVHYVNTLISANHMEKHLILPVALSNKESCTTLYKDEVYASGSSIIQGFRPDNFYTSTEVVITAKGDKVIKDLGIDVISLIKIDVEGGELEVIEGLLNTIERHKPPIIFEVLPNFLLYPKKRALTPDVIKIRTERAMKLEAIIRQNDYEICQIIPPDKLVVRDGISLDHITKLDEANFIAISSEELREILGK